MFKTQVYLTENERDELVALSKSLGKSKSALIRNAIDDYIASKRGLLNKKKPKTYPAAGIWAERTDLPDFSELRNELNR